MKTPTTQPLPLPVRLTRSLRTPLWKKTVSSILLAQFALWSVQVKGATFVWDGDATAGNNVLNLSGTAPTATNFGGAGTWAAANTFWNGTTNQAWSNAGLDTAWFAGLSGGAVALTGNQTVGGLIFTTGNYSTTLTGANTLTLGGAPGANIISAYASASIGTASVNGILGTSGLIKNGGGTLTVLGTNTGFSGAVAVNGGALTLNGGANLGQTQLNTSTITLNFGTLNILNNGAGSNTAAAIAYGNDVVINGNSTIGVNNAGANTNNTIAIPSLTVNNSAVTFTSANGYGLQVTGATTLFGAITTLNSGFNPLPSGAAGVAASANNTAQLVALTGAVGGSGALNKQGAGTVTLQAANTYTGGTNILAGSLLLNTNAATLSSGKVIVNPGTTLGIVSSGNVTGSNLYLPSSLSTTGGTVAILRANANADLSGGSLNAAVVGTYGASYQLDTGTTGVAGAAGSNAIFDPNTGAYVAAATYLQNIDLNNFGSTAAGTGRIMLGSTAANTTMSGTVSNSSGGDIRFGGSGILTLSATDALGTTAQTVQIGSPIVNAQPLTGATGTTAFSGANNTNYTGTMTVNKGAVLQAPALTGTNVFGTGPLTVLGGSVNVLNNAAATNYTGGPQIGNSVINLYPSAGVVTGAGSLFTLDNSAVTTGGGTTNLRLVGTTPINAYGGSTFSLIGSNTGATTTTQNTGAYGFQGGNVINLSTNTTAATNADGVITIANLVRNGNGTMTFTRAAGSPTAFGTSSANNDARINLTQLNGATPVVTNGSIAPWLVDQTSNTFLTYGANGIAPVIYSAATLATATANDLVTSGAVAITANSTVHALQLTGAITQTGGPFTITIGANSTATDGAGLIMTSASTHTPNFSFGTAGAREAVIYNSAAVTLSGTIAASGLTKFGTANLTLTGVNSGLTGTITVNQGILIGTTTGYNFRPITLAGGGQLDFSNTANGIYLNDVTVTGESIISAGGGTPRINSLTIAARLGSATAPVSLMVNSGTVVGNYGSTYVSGSGTSITGGGLVLDAPTNWINGSAAISGTAALNTNILGVVSGTGTLNKWGNAPLSFSNAANTYSGGTVVNGAGGDNRATVRSLVGTSGATPFGSGSITLNPAGIVTLFAPDNASTNALIVNSDLTGLGMVSLQYGGSAALPTFASTTFNNGNLGVAFSGVLASEAVGFSTPINLDTLWGGTAFLGGGNSGGGPAANFTGALTPSTVGLVVADLNGGAPVTGNSVYRIGAGGGSTMQFTGAANQFTGATDLQVGAISNVTAAASVNLLAGNANTNILNSNNLSGNVYLNTGGVLVAGNNTALGTAKIVFNGGTIQADGSTGLPFFNTTRTLANNIGFTGDATFGGSTDLILGGAISLADNQNGVTRSLNTSNTTGITYLNGVISDGAGSATGNSITKAGAGALVLGTSNTYTGFTNINAGTLVVTGDNNIPSASKVTLGGGALGAWTTSFTTTRDYILTAASNFDVGAGVTLTQGGPTGSTPGSNISGAFALTKIGLGTLTLNGNNSMSGVSVNNGILQAAGSGNLGDPNAASAITLNGGTFRPTSTFTTNRPLTATNGSVDVPTGVNLTLTGVISGANFLKTGLGTFTNNTGTNTNTVLTVQNGTMLFDGTNTAFAAAATPNINGGTLQFTNTANRTVTTTGIASFGGGGRIGIQSAAGAATGTAITVGSLNRSAAGTIIIDPGTSALAATGANTVRLIPSTNINTVAVASANINGMLPANIVTQVSGIGGFSTRTANGIGTFSAFSSTVSGGTLGVTTNASTVDVTTAPVTAFTNATSSIYALRTNQNVAGGTLRISSINGTTATNQGGLIINGSRTIGANLIFDPTAASGGSAASGEGLVYVNPSSSANISGAVHGTSFVKFGSGNLQLSGASTGIINALTVHEGTLTLGGGLSFNKLQTDLVLTNTGTLDLGGQRLSFNSLGNGAAVTGTIAGGLVTSSTGAGGTLVVSGASGTSTFAGQITETGGNTISLVKSGTNTLVLAPFNIAAPEAGNNNFAGGATVNQGVLTVQDPRALGTGTLTIQGAATVNFASNGAGINSTIITGAPGGSGLNVVNNGNAILNVDRIGANSGNVFQFNNLALNEGQLDLRGSNSYRARFNGTTTIAGGFGTITSGGADFTGAGELAGLITGSGALVKLGTNYFKGLIISGTANNYSGGTQIQSGYLQVTSSGASDTPLGSGVINVYPGAALRIGANNTSIASNLHTLSRWNSFGIVGIDNDNFDPATTLTSTSFSNAYGTILAITRPNYTGTLDQSTIGDGRSILATGPNNTSEVGFLGTLAPGLGDGVASRTYRLSGGNNASASNLAVIGVDNILNDSAGVTSLVVGARVGLANNGIVQNAGGAVIIRNSNSYTGGTWIGKANTLQIETGASPAGSTPLGSSDGTLTGNATNVEVFGVLQNSGIGSSFVNAATGKNSITTTIRPGGFVVVNDQLGIAAGGQGRWADSDANGGGVALGNGAFQYNGAAGLPSVEQIGTLSVTGAGRVVISRVNDANTATLILSNLSRTAPGASGTGIAGGTLTIEPRVGATNTVGILGIPNLATTQAQQAAGFVRLLTNSGAPTLGGTTANGAGVTNSGMAPAWIIDAAAASFVTYNPTAANTGFQPLVSVAGTFPAAGTQNPGQAGYNKVITAALVSGNLAAGDIVDLTTAGNTLADPTTTIYALRTNQNLNATATNNTLNITSGGLILNAALTINAAANAANAQPVAMSLQFGGGSGEGFIYKAGAFDQTINANISASNLTIFSNQGNNNTLILTGNNNLTGPVTANTRMILQNTLSNTGVALGGVFNGQDVILGGAASRDANLLRLAGAVDDATGGGQASNSLAMSLYNSTFYVNGDARIDANASAITQRILNLTIADRGVRSPGLLYLSNIYVQGTTTLGISTSDTSILANFDNFAATTLAGLVQGGQLSKFGNGTLMVAGTANTFASLVVNGHDFNTATSIVGSLTQTGTPFGTGAITVNPGGGLRIMNASNIASNSSIIVKTDGQGLGSIGVSTNLTQAQLNGLFGTGAGKVEMTSTHANYIGALTLDANSWNSALDIAALETAIGGSKKLVIGTTINPLQTYFNSGLVNYNASSITSSSDNIIRLGAGGNQGGLAFGVGTWENVFGVGKNIELGAATAANGGAATQLINGNTGAYIFNTRNTAFNGTVTLNPGSQLVLENAYALGSGTIVLNLNSGTSGTMSFGGLRVNNSQTISNAINVTGDSVNIFSGDNIALNGNVNLNPTGGVGGTKQFGLATGGNNASSNAAAFNGVISGTGVNIIKTSGTTNTNGGSYIFRGANTYTGTTTINAGYLVTGGNVSADPTVAGPFGMSDTPVVLANVGAANTAGSLSIGGQYTFARSIIAQGNNGNILGNIRGQTLNGAVITGGIAITQVAVTGGGLALDNAALTTGFGGVLDLQGPITGTGSVQIGNGSTGTVRLSANANGVSTSTYAGGTNIWGGRVQVGADASFTGTSAVPTIITSPFGTGPLFLGRRGSTTAGIGDQAPTFIQIDAFGGDRTIVNALGAINRDGATTITFGGRNNLTFSNTASFDINTDTGGVRSRTFEVRTPGTVTMASAITNSAAGNFVKDGRGTLVLTGTNTQVNTNTGDSNYGRSLFIDQGVLSVGSDANLGSTTLLAAAQSHLANLPGDIALRGGVLQATGSFSTIRQFQLSTAASAIDVVGSGTTLTLTQATSGALALTKVGTGTLSLNPATSNTITTLTIGGTPIGGGTVNSTASPAATPITPFATTTVNILGGTLGLVGGAAAQATTIPTVNFGSGSRISLNRGATTTLLTATALTRTNQGTLIIQPTTTTADLGAVANFAQLRTSTVFTTTNNMLATPTVILQDPSTNDFNFVQYGANGFAVHATTTTTSLAASAATNLADLTAATVVAAGNIDVYAVRTSANITPTDGTSVLRIINGGLILNGTATPPNISTRLEFDAGTAGTPGEGFVYVRGGQTGVSTISGAFTATNFTKSGGGSLLISSTGNVMAPTSTQLRNISINEGTLRFAGQTSIPSSGLVTISPMDTGIFDVNGQSLTIGGLGNPNGTAITSTGNVSNSGAASTLTLAVNNQTSTFAGLIAGNIGITKSGIGTQVFAFNNFTGIGTGGNTYTGGTTVNAGQITSGTGIFTPVGALTGTGISSFGTGGITLAGGQINFNSTTAASEVDHSLGILTQGPNNGYDITIAANNNFGTANTTSTLSNTLGATPGNAWQGINTLNVLAPVVTFGTGSATANQGILVKGQTTFAGNSTINVTGNAVLSGRLAAAGFTLTKLGGQPLFLTNTELSSGASTVGSWNLLAGTTEVRMSDGGSNPLGTNTLTLNGSQLNLRHDGDNLADPQTLTTFGSSVITVGSTTSAGSPDFTSSVGLAGGNVAVGTYTTLDARQLAAGASNKTLQIGTINFGGALGSPTLTFQGANNYGLKANGGITMIKDAYLALNNNAFTIDTQLSGNGTFVKVGGGELNLNTVATNTGGTMLFQGVTNFGSFEGNTRTLSTTAQFAPGDITVNTGTVLRFNSTSNLNAASRVDVRANMGFYGIVGIGSNEAINAFNLRAPLAGGPSASSMVTAYNTGAGVLAINHPAYNQTIDLSKLGDGTWFVGSNNNAAGVTAQSSAQGVYVGSAAIVPSPAAYNFGFGSSNNSNNVLRLGGNNGAGNIFTIGLPGGTANTLTNITGAFAKATSLVVGGPSTGVTSNGSTGPIAVGGTVGTLILNTAQNYSGNTLVNVGSVLEFRGAMSTSGYEVFGTLAAGGANGSFAGGPNPVMRAGSLVRLDNTFDLNSNASGRWGDATAVNLNSSTLRLLGNAAADITEVAGTVNYSGGSFLTTQRAIAGRSAELNIAGFGTRGAGATLSIEPITAAQLGTDERVTVAGANLAAQIANIPGGLTNGMVSPTFFNQRDGQFLTYSTFGFVNAGFDFLSNTATPSAITGGTNRALFGSQTTTTLGAAQVIDVHALRLDSNGTTAAVYAPNTATSSVEKFIIRSGGLIGNGNNQANVTVTAGLQFGPTGSPTEALIAVPGSTLTIGDSANPSTSGQITATSISKSGDGALTIQSYQPGFTGNIYLNRGTLTLSEPAISASNATTNVGGVNGTIFMNGATTLLNLRSDSGNAVNGTTTFQNSISLAAGSIMQRIDLNHLTLTNTNAREFILSNLTFGGTSGDQGQTLTVGTGANPTNNISLRIGGTTDLGPVGNAYFNLVGSGTNLTLAGSIIGSGTLVAEGNQATLFLGQNGVVPTTGWSTGGGLIVTTRTVQANVAPVTIGANSAIDTGRTYLGSGPITLAGGTLNISADSGADTTFRTYSFPAGNTVTVTGNATMGANRITGAGTNKLLAFPSLNIGGQTLTSSSTNTHSIQFNAVNITGTPTFAVSNDLVVGTVKDNSAGLYVVKNGTGTLWFNDNTSSNSPVFVNQGLLRFGNPGANSVTATAGTGAIQLNPLGAIRVDAPANVPTAGQVTSIGTAWSLPISRVGAALTQAQIVAYTNAASTNTQLRLDTGNSNALNMAAIGDGSFILGSNGAATYSGNTLGAGNQVTLGQNGYVAGATGGTYRLGSNDAAATIFTLAPATATNTILTGTSNVVIGTLAVGGNNGTGTVLFNNTNNYSLGTTISRGSEGRIQSGTTNTPLGSGQVDVFGTLRAVNTNGSFIGSGTTNNNAIVMHPGSAIVLDGTGSANNANRWGDTNAVALNGSSFTMQTLTGTAQNEVVGAITYANGSRIGINNPGSPAAVNTLTAASLGARTGTATLVFVPQDVFGTNANGSDNFVATAGLPATVVGVNMLPAYIVSGASAVVTPSFLTDAGGGSNRLIYTTYSAANFAGSTNTSIGDVTANTTLAGDVSAFAFRIGNFTVSNAPGQLNTITLNQAGAAGGGILATATANINPNLNFNNQEALIYSHTGTLTLNGDISGVSSVGITKFGGGALAIGKDQTDAARGTGNGYNNGWTVNEGQLTPNTFGALGNAVSTNVVRLNASTAAGANANGITGAAVLRLAVNAGNPSLNYYTMGNLQVLDAATISYDPGANDRMSALGAAGSLSNIVVTSTGGNLNEAQLFLDTNRDRSMVVAGNLQIVADSGTAAGLQLRVHNSNFNGANSSGLSVNTLIGVSDTRITKIGSGELYIRGNSSSFDGTLNIEQGAVGVFNNGSLGSATSITNVKRYGVLDVQVANFTPTGTVNYQLGGIERWSVDGARTGTLNLGTGTLQVNNDQTANTLAVTMGGGSIEGYLRLDDNLTGGQGQAVYRTLNSNITFNLTADSFLGQNINQGLNGYDNGRQPVVFSTTGNSVVGAVLEIKGAITGTGGLTKQGYDTVTLSSASNNYSGQTNVVQGQLRAGVNNALPSSNIVSTTGGAVLDLNGYNLSIGRITSPASGFTASTFTPNLANSNPTGSGYITNSALDTTKTLSVGNGANGTSADFTYGGVIQYNIALEKNGAAVLNLTNANTYNGGTIINGGWLNAANTLAGTTGSATGTGPVSIETGATLAGAGTVAGIVTLKAGGTIQPGALTAGAVGTPTSQSGVLTLGGLTINGGTLVFNLDTPGSITDDEINLTGIGAGILNVTATPTITITNAGGFAAGLYKLIGFANGTVTGFGNLPVNPASPVGGLILTTVNNPNEVSLLVQANTTVKWTGAENQLWDLVNPHTAPKNWVDLTANPADFVDSLDVTFDDTATGFAPVVSGTIKPKSISFLNTTGFNYTLGTDGTGIIADDTAPTALTKLNTGGLTINIGTNTFTGGSTITAGTTTFGASTTVVTGAITQGPLGLGTIIARNSTFSDNGTAITLSNALNIDGNLTFATTGGGSLSFLADAGKVTTITNVASNTNLTVNTGTNTTINQAIGGTGKGITKLGNGTLTLGGNNGYNGGTTVTNGTLTLATTGNLASGSNLSVASTAVAVNLNNTAAQVLGTLTADSAVNLNTATTTTITTLNGASTGIITQGTGTSNLSVNVGTYAGTILGTAAVTKTGGSGDTLTFTSAGSTYSNGTTLTGGIITVGASTVSGATITSGPIGTGTLAMAAGTSLNAQTADQTLANALTINGNISLGGTNDLTIDGTALTVPTNITLLATSQITTAAGLIESFNSVVTDGAGTFAITKAGTGQLNLNNVNNTYTGITTIIAGVLGVTSLENQTGVAGTNADSLGNSSNAPTSLVINGATATLQYLGAGSTTDRQMSIGNTGAILDASGSGAVNFTNNTAAGLTMSGTGARTLTLQGSNTGSNILSALITNQAANATAITKQGTGTWRLANTASTTTGITTLSGGVLEVTKLAPGGSASSIGQSTSAVTNLIFNNGATLRWIGDGVVNNDTTDRLMTYASGNGVIDASPTDSTKSLTFSNAGAVSYTGAPLNQAKTLTWTGTGGTTANPNVFTPTIGNNGTGNTQIVKDGTGVWRFAGVSAASDFFSIRNGTVIVNNVQNGGVSSNLGAGAAAAGNLLLGSATTAGTLRFDGSGGVNNSTDRLFTLGAAGGTLDASGASGTPLSFTNAGSIVMAAATTTPRTLTLTGSNADANNITSIIPNGTGAGLTSLAKTGDGTWQLSGVNTYTGATTISDGTLRNGVNNAINTASPVTVSASNASDSATWNLQTFNQTSNSITLGGNTNSTSTVTGSGSSTLTLGGNVIYDATNNPGQATISVTTVALGTAARTFTVGNSTNANTDLVVGSVISSGAGGSVVKAGAGTMVVTGQNTYSGGTAVNDGRLLVNNTVGSGTGTGAVTVSNTGTILGGSGTVAGNLTVNAGALIAPGGDVNTAGTLTIGGSTVVIAGNGSPETRMNFDYTNATGNIAGLSPATWASYSGSLLTGNGGQANDLLNFTAGTTSLTWNTGGKISLNQIGSPYSWIQGDVFNLLDWTALSGGSIGGTFNSAVDFDLPSLGGGLAWDTTRFVTTGAIAVVPEPGRALLMLLGLMALFFRRRRQD